MAIGHDLPTAAPSSAPLRYFGAFDIDAAAGMLRLGSAEIPLRRQTWQLLCLLAANPRRLCTKADLTAAIWPRTVVGDDSLVQCVVELRRALGDTERRLIRTVPRRGYRFDADVQVHRNAACATRLTAVPDERLTLAWRGLTLAADLEAVVGARRLFEAVVCERALRADAMAGVAMSHVIEALNRWTWCPAWNIAVAHEAAEEAMTLDPTNPRACHALAHVATLEGRHVEAFLGFRAALTRDPTMARARLRMGIIELELGHAERTGYHVQQALHTSDGDDVLQAQAYFIRGMSMFHLGMDADSSLCMKRVLMLRPQSGFAHQWLASIDALHDDAGSSEEHLSAFRRQVPGHTVDSLRSTERSHDATFVLQRNRFYEGLKRAGLN
jgi:DNA-binding winged helix-turn-helix (wHTH) protein